MKLKLFATSIVLATTLAFSGSLRADFAVTQITSNSYKASFPRIEGNYLVWQGHVGNDWEIFLYDIAAGETSQITDNDYDDLSPQTDGNYIVWQGFNNGEWDIFLWDGTQIRAISDRSAEDLSPQVANGLIVWCSEPFGDDFVGPSEVILYDAGTQTRTVLSVDVDPDNTLDDSGPKINDEVVTWVQTDDQDNTTSYMYDLSNGSITENPEYVWRDTPQRDGILSVLSRHDGQDREIFVYSSNSRRYYQVTNNSLEDRYPSISDNHMVWMAGGEVFFAEFKLLAIVSPKDDAILSEKKLPTFTWEGIGYHEFKVEFSKDPDFAAKDTLALPSGEHSWLSKSPFTPTKKEWKQVEKIGKRNSRVYWRVKGKDADGGVAFSETRSFTFVDGQRRAADTNVTAIDQGVQGVISDGDGDGDGGDGLCFIGTVAD